MGLTPTPAADLKDLAKLGKFTNSPIRSEKISKFLKYVQHDAGEHAHLI